MLHFCTLFDSFYLSRGLAMYKSLVETGTKFHLYIFAFDKLSENILNKEDLPQVTVISLEKLENEKLLQIKSSRSRAEYCWTCTPWTIKFVLENYNTQKCTYIDADLYFINNPTILEDELGNEGKILITEHRYSWFAKIYEEKRAGRFCVQYLTVKNTEIGKKVLDNWANQCVEWCYNRYEDNKFGDQKYLDEWPLKYTGIKILEHLGGGLAPWNAKQYKYSLRKNAELTLTKGIEKYPIVFYHFHFVRFYTPKNIDIGWHKIPRFVKTKLYIPYIKKINTLEKSLQLKYPSYTRKYNLMESEGIKNKIKVIIKKHFQFNMLRTNG